MFPTDYWKSDILHWVIKTRNKRKMWRIAIKCQTENPLTSYNSKPQKCNSKCTSKRQNGSEPAEIIKNGNEM